MSNAFPTLLPCYKRSGAHNPLYTQRFGADPGVLVWLGRLYVYTTNDLVEYAADGSVTENRYGRIRHINCISSDDLVNWTDHGAIPVAGEGGAATWASNSWAPCAAHKEIDGQDRFFLYFCNGGNGVSVLTADSPEGPWRDPLGHGLITRGVHGCADVPWLFDPSVLVDRDGTGYLYFGGGVPEGKQAAPRTIRCVRLGEDMISLASEVQVIDAPYAFEDSGINRIGDTYYYTYCSNFSTAGNSLGITDGAIQYMTADHPMGPFTWRGEFSPNPGRYFGLYGNHHHSIAAFRDRYYLLYHSRIAERAMGIEGNYRSPMINELTVNPDGSLAPVTLDEAGVEQLQLLNPYSPVCARTMARQAGMTVTGCGESEATSHRRGHMNMMAWQSWSGGARLITQAGAWMQIAGADFFQGAEAFVLMAASDEGCRVRVTEDEPEGRVVCEMTIPPCGMSTHTAPMQSVDGVHDLCIAFSGRAEVVYWQVPPTD